MTSELARRGIDVTCISSTASPAADVEHAHRNATERDYEFVHVPFSPSGSPLRGRLANLRHPFSEHARSKPLLETIERELARGYDVFHVEHLFNSWLTRGRDRSVSYVHCLEVVDRSDVEATSFRDRQVLWQMRRATRHLLSSTERVIVMTDRLKREVRRWRRAPVAVAPMGLDTDLYELTPLPLARSVGLLGSMYWLPSRRAAERLLGIWPEIRRQVPSATLRVGGWGARRHLDVASMTEGAEVVSDVADASSFFREMRVLVYAPPRGSGMKVKVLEAMAYGRPVVTNDEGAEGLETLDGAGLRLARTDEELVEATCALLEDDGLASEVGAAGRRAIGSTLGPEKVGDRLLEAYGALGLLGLARRS